MIARRAWLWGGAGALGWAWAGKMGLAAGPAAPDAALFDGVLKRFVTAEGKVRYGGLKKDLGALEEFARQVGEVSPDSHPNLFVSREARLAYWINAYNALVLLAFTREYPEKRTRLSGKLGQFAFFYRMKHRVGGVWRSLDDIETKSIRKGFGEPRIHFAIVCASAGCPWLARDAYTGANVMGQLERETKRYFGQARNFGIDRQRRVVTLPAILDWFQEDFGGTPEKALAFVAKYRPAEAAELTGGRWRVKYFEYDWSPNDAE